MQRREMLGAMAALFAGVLLPAPVIEIIRVRPIVPVPYIEPAWMRTAMTGFMNTALYGGAKGGGKCKWPTDD